MSTPSDPYQVLQVHAAAEHDVIRAAYLCLAKRHHPDAGGTSERMAALNEAWTVLGDPGRRAAYDAARATRSARSGAGSMGSGAGEAGAAPGASPAAPTADAGGSTLDFGRYAGRTLEALARDDPDYLEWLARSPGGRRYRARIFTLLTQREPRTVPRAAQPPLHRGGWRLPWRTRATG